MIPDTKLTINVTAVGPTGAESPMSEIETRTQAEAP
ncbi:hypothetical protein STFR1_130014 [Bacillus vallismortis]